MIDIETTLDEVDTAPSSNKKLKTTNSDADKSIENTIKDTSAATNTSQNIEIESHLEQAESVLGTEKIVQTHDKDTIVNEGPAQTVDKSPDEVTPVLVAEDTSESINNTIQSSSSPPRVQENENIQIEKMDTSEETDQSPENNSEMSRDREALPAGEEEDEDILLSFQDIPKDA